MTEPTKKVVVQVDLLDLALLAAEANKMDDINKAKILRLMPAGASDELMKRIRHSMVVRKAIGSANRILGDSQAAGFITGEEIKVLIFRRFEALNAAVEGAMDEAPVETIRRLEEFMADPLV